MHHDMAAGGVRIAAARGVAVAAGPAVAATRGAARAARHVVFGDHHLTKRSELLSCEVPWWIPLHRHRGTRSQGSPAAHESSTFRDNLLSNRKRVI